MRRRLRPLLPALAHWFGLRWEHLEVMPWGEVEAYVEALPPLPVGGAFQFYKE